MAGDAARLKHKKQQHWGRETQEEMSQTPPWAGTDFVVLPTKTYIPSAFVRGNTGS